MSFDRGFIKWQPFNSVASPKQIFESMNQSEKIIKPGLFPEKQELLNELIIEAYYSKSKIRIYFYDENKIKMIETTIRKIYPNSGTLEFYNHHIISFNQIINII